MGDNLEGWISFEWFWFSYNLSAKPNMILHSQVKLIRR